MARDNAETNGRSARHASLKRMQANDQLVSTTDGSAEAEGMVHEISNLVQLLSSLLAPACNNGGHLTTAERKHIKYFLSQIETSLDRLSRLV